MPRTVPVPVGGSDARLPRAPGARTARAGPRGTAPRAGRAPRRGARVQPLPTERSPVILASSLFVLCSAVSAGTIKLDRNGGVSISHATHSGAQHGAPVKGRHAWARVSARVCVHVCTRVCCVCTCGRVSTRVGARLHVYVCMCVHTCVRVCTCAPCLHMWRACLGVCACLQVCACACVCMCACVCTYMYVCLCA